MAYSILNTRGSLVTTVNDVTVNTSTPLNLVGRGVSGYGQMIETSLFQMLENFAASTPVVAPPVGMLWYDTTSGLESLRVWDGSIWSRIGSGQNSASILLDRLPGCTNLSFAVAGATPVYTGVTGKRTFVTSILLIPRAGVSVTPTNAPPTFQLEVTAASSDVMDKVALVKLSSVAAFAYFAIEGTNRIVQSGDTVNLVVDTPLTNPDVLSCDVYMFGHVRT